MMEKGSFHSSPPSGDATSLVQASDELVRGIPLPNQMPRGLDFMELPASALKSSTLEHLISQNEDLMARLNVALRKINQLEESQLALTQESGSFRLKFESLREQYLVLKEKDQRFTARTQELASANASANEHRERLEKTYSELYIQAKAFQRRLVQLERYRARVRKAKSKIQEQARRAPLLEKELRRIENNTIESRKILTASHLQMVNNYEAKLATLGDQLAEYKTKVEERDQIFAERLKLSNQLVFEQRQNQQHREETQAVIDRLERETRELRMELKENLIQSEADRRALSELREDLPEYETDLKALREQVESLQALWAHKQKELEQSEEKNRSLQKLNQTLGVNLNNQRKEMQQAKDLAEQEQYQANEAIKKLLAEIQELRRQGV